MWNNLLIGAALAAVVGAPAMAQSWQPSVGSGNIVSAYSGPAGSSGYGADGGGYGASGAYAFAPRHDDGPYGRHPVHRWYRD